MGTLISVPCAKGCGHTIPTDEQTLNNAALLGVPLTIEHDTCPTEPPPPAADEAPAKPRRFRVQLIALEITGDDPAPDVDYVAQVPGTEILAGLGETFDAKTFAEAVNGPITVWLNTAWPRFQETAAFADLPGGNPAQGG